MLKTKERRVEQGARKLSDEKTARLQDRETQSTSLRDDLCIQVTLRYMNLDSILQIMFIFGLEVIQTRRQKLCLQRDMVLYMTI